MWHPEYEDFSIGKYLTISIWNLLLILQHVLNYVKFWRWMNTCIYATLRTQVNWSKHFMVMRFGAENLETATIQCSAMIYHIREIYRHRRRPTSTNTILYSFYTSKRCTPGLLFPYVTTKNSYSPYLPSYLRKVLMKHLFVAVDVGI